jgi:hypothetical protein
MSRAILVLMLTLAAATICQARDKHIVKVEAVDYQEKVIYHSPEKPGSSAWVGVWRFNDKRVFCSFVQTTGPKENPKVESPLIESDDEGQTWKVLPLAAPRQGAPGSGLFETGRDAYTCRGMEVLDGGKTLVRPVWPASVSVAGYVVRSTDGGKTWSKRIDLLPEDKWGVWPSLVHQLRDGRLILFAGCWRRGEKISSGDGPMRKMFFISRDKGKTWSEPIPLMDPEQGMCEESDFCELANGDLLWVSRSEFYPDHPTEAPPGSCRMGAAPPQSNWYSIRNQTFARKKGKTFVPEAPTLLPIPHSGYPLVIKTKEGVILHLGTNGVHWTADEGKTWNLTDIPGTAYYPKGFQFKDGKIIVIGHVGGDDVYGTVDQSIKQQTFKLKITKE